MSATTLVSGPDRWLTQQEVCDQLHISSKTLQLWRRAGRIQFVRMGHRSVRIRKSELDRFLGVPLLSQPGERKPPVGVPVPVGGEVEALLNEIEHGGHTPERRWELAQRLRDLLSSLRRSAGSSAWAPIGFALLSCLALVWIAHRQSERTFYFTAPADRFQILKRFPDGYNYLFRHIHTADGRTVSFLVHAKFCAGYMPPFSAGETLTRLAYVDFGSCWYIQADTLGYDFEVDLATGHDTLAPNCHETPRIVVCEPILNEARFPGYE